MLEPMSHMMDDSSKVTETVLALERSALDRWGKGDPSGCLEISAPDVSYFDPYLEKRVDGIDALTAWYEPIRGKIKIDHDEIINPRVQVFGDTAVLTMRYDSSGSEGTMRWNCTDVYHRQGNEWKIVHTHWSFTKVAQVGSE